MSAYILFTFFLAGLVKGVIGMGLPTVVVGLLGVVMPPAAAAALMVIPSLVTNVWQAFAGPHLRLLIRRIGPLLGGIVAGLWTTAALRPAIDDRLATTALGLILVAYVLIGRLLPAGVVPSRHASRLAAPVGLVTGAITAITGVFVIPAVPYLQRLGLERDALIQALGLAFLTATLALGAALLPALGRLFTDDLRLLAAAVAAALAGMQTGQALRTRISLKAFQTCFFWGLLALGVHLTVRGLRG